MPAPQKEPLRPLSAQEYQQLQRIIKASSEPLDRVRRAKALLAVAGGTWSNAAVYPARRVVVEHGRVGTEDNRASSTLWATPAECRGSDRVARRDGEGLEPPPDPIHMGRQATRAAQAGKAEGAAADGADRELSPLMATQLQRDPLGPG